MTTATLPIDIVCPDWCTVEPHEHVADLGDLSGSCIHWASSWFVDDPEGFLTNPLDETSRIRTGSIEVRVTTSTLPDGRLNAAPLVFLGDTEHTVEQIDDLITTLREAVRFVRAKHSEGTER